MPNDQVARETMIRQQLRTTGVLNNEILQIIREVPRALFVSPAYQNFAYADALIPLAHGQQMLLPETEAQMLQAAAIQATDHVLEVGTGSGYFTALLAKLATQVTSVDIFQDILDDAQKNTWFQKCHNVSWQCADFSKGPLNKQATYDVIVITGALYTMPAAFLDALKPEGRLVAIVGGATIMEGLLYKKTTTGITKQRLFDTVAPYLVNAELAEKFKF